MNRIYQNVVLVENASMIILQKGINITCNSSNVHIYASDVRTLYWQTIDIFDRYITVI